MMSIKIVFLEFLFLSLFSSIEIASSKQSDLVLHSQESLSLNRFPCQEDITYLEGQGSCIEEYRSNQCENQFMTRNLSCITFLIQSISQKIISFSKNGALRYFIRSITNIIVYLVGFIGIIAFILFVGSICALMIDFDGHRVSNCIFR